MMAAGQFARALNDLYRALSAEPTSVIYEQLFRHAHSNHSPFTSGDEMEVDLQDVSNTFNRFLSDLATLCSRVEIQTAAASFASIESGGHSGDLYPSRPDAYAGQIMASPQKRPATMKEHFDTINIQSDDTVYNIDLNQTRFHKIGAPITGIAASYLQPPRFTAHAYVPAFVAPHIPSSIRPAYVATKASYLRSANHSDGLRANVLNNRAYPHASITPLSAEVPTLLTNDQLRDLHGASPSKFFIPEPHQFTSPAFQVPQHPTTPSDHVTLSREEFEGLQDCQRQLQNIQFQLVLQTPLDGIFGTTKSETSPTQQLKCRLSLPAIDVADYAQKLRDVLLDRMAAFTQEVKRNKKTKELFAAVKVSGEIMKMGLDSPEVEVTGGSNKRGRPKKAAKKKKKKGASVAPTIARGDDTTEDEDESDHVTPAPGAEDDSENTIPTPGEDVQRRTNVPRNKAKVRDNF